MNPQSATASSKRQRRTAPATRRSRTPIVDPAGKMKTISLRRSVRLKKPTVRDTEFLLELPCSNLQSVTGLTEDTHIDLISPLSSPNKATLKKDSVRVSVRKRLYDCSDSDYADAPQHKKKRNCVAGHKRLYVSSDSDYADAPQHKKKRNCVAGRKRLYDSSASDYADAPQHKKNENCVAGRKRLYDSSDLDYADAPQYKKNKNCVPGRRRLYDSSDSDYAEAPQHKKKRNYVAGRKRLYDSSDYADAPQRKKNKNCVAGRKMLHDSSDSDYADAPQYKKNRNCAPGRKRIFDSSDSDYADAPQYKKNRNCVPGRKRIFDSTDSDYAEAPQHKKNKNCVAGHKAFYDSSDSDYADAPQYKKNRNCIPGHKRLYDSSDSDYADAPRHKKNKNCVAGRKRLYDSSDSDYADAPQYKKNRNCVPGHKRLYDSSDSDYADAPQHKGKKNCIPGRKRLCDSSDSDYADAPQYKKNRNCNPGHKRIYDSSDSDYADAPQHKGKKNCIPGRKRLYDSSQYAEAPQQKKNRSYIPSEVEYLDGITDPRDVRMGERPAGYYMKSCDYKSGNELLCSICQIGEASNFLVQCKHFGCLCAFHIFCLSPPLQTIGEDWLCPYCDRDTLALKLMEEPITKRIESIVGHKRVITEAARSTSQVEFLIKWKYLSHHHDSWVPLEWLHLVNCVRVCNYQKRFLIMNEAHIVDHRKPEWFKIDRVITCRRKLNSDVNCEIMEMIKAKQDYEELEFLVKWLGLDYCEATWESSYTEELLEGIKLLIQRYEKAARKVENCSQLSINTVQDKMADNLCGGILYDDKLPDHLYGGVLYDYQLLGLRWILSNFNARRNIILADEMGLGKTVQVVSFVNCMKHANLNANPVLIIAPKSILFQWEKEFHHWAKELNVIIYQGEKESRRCIQAHEMYSSEKRVMFDALVTNYELILLDSRVLKKFKWSAIIMDEAHKVKRFDCKLACCLKYYISDFRLLLTGTPLQNTLLELFALLHFIDPEQFSDPKAEAEAFSSIKAWRGQTEAEMKITQIHELLKPRMLRRMKSDVLRGSIPIKKWIEVPCALTDFQRELYIDILEMNYKKLNGRIQSGKKIILNFILLQLKKCCNHTYLFPGHEIIHSTREDAFVSLVANSGKLQLLEKLLPKLKERGSRVLLFSQMTKMLDILEDFLEYLGLTYFRMDGQTSVAARQERMKEFNNPESDTFVFLISTRAGGMGIDLPTADRVIIYDPDFNPFMDLQAQSRAHRIGQTRPVVVYQLITKCSVEVKILEKSKKKLALENLVMNPSKKPNADDLHSMLLHGARTILCRKEVHATFIQYDDDAIEKLLKLDPVPGEECPSDDNGYLGSIDSFTPEADGGEDRASSPKAKEWKEILGHVSTEIAAGSLGRGKRERREVKYECDDKSDSDDVSSPEGSSDRGKRKKRQFDHDSEEKSDDDIYSPEGSSTDDSSESDSEVSLEKDDYGD